MAASLSITTSSCSAPLWVSNNLPQPTHGASAFLSLSSGSRTRRSNLSMNATSTTTTPSGLLHCSFLTSSSSLSFPSSSFSGLSLGFDFNSSNIGTRREKGLGLVVRAGKAALCQTKRNRSRKSLARTHGFRRRMRTTTGRAILKRRRAKGRWVLCTKSNPNSGKAS